MSRGKTAAGLMRITPPPVNIVATKEIIITNPVGAGQTVTLKTATNYKFAIMLFHGDGSGDVQVRIQGDTTRTINGNEQGIELIAGETVTLAAQNTNTTTSRNHPTIEILTLGWS
jgi:hypothetical protein